MCFCANLTEAHYSMSAQPAEKLKAWNFSKKLPRHEVFSIIPLAEITLATTFLTVGILISFAFGFDFSFPSSKALDFTGMSYSVPLSLISLLGFYLIWKKQTMRLAYYVTAAAAYAIILTTHFNIKLWSSLINPNLWDSFYWKSDQMFRPLIETSFFIHREIEKLFQSVDHLYLFAFLAMFAGSIIVHSMQCFMVFRKVLFSAMLVHVLGGLSYLAMPAVGPFIYEPGVNALETARQEHMYGGYRALLAGGRPWISSQGSQFMFAAVAAMPSLHVASSAVFVHYAWQHARWLGMLYLPLFTFIMFEAMATRWHYAIDLAAGLALTAVAIAVTAAVFRPIETHQTMRNNRREAPASA